MSGWWVYILRCGDGTLYTGMTDDPERRLAAHRSGHGAKYTRGRGPLELVYSEACGTRGDALRREAAIKQPAARRRSCGWIGKEKRLCDGNVTGLFRFRL